MLRYALLLSAALTAAAVAGDAKLAPTPPMGWNSWDAYGLTITEADFKANAAVLATMKSLGWSYAVIDEGWYMDNPFGAKLADRKYVLDDHGLLMPSLPRFPSAAGGAGLKPLGDWVHGQGLKFGVHVVRGIPKQAVDADLPIAGSRFRSSEAADKSDLCPWDDGNYGVKDNAAGQAYYDSMVKRYADWGVDYIKIDCISDHPYKPAEIRQVHDAIIHSGRGILLSLSPGPTNILHAEEVGRLSELWRIADDSWDGWDFAPAPWPNGILTGFKKLSEWHAYAKPGTWPDADMLPFGSLTPHPGWGEPRQSRLTADETRTWFTLWAIARSPLILGANLTKLEDGLKALITNKEVIAVNQTAWESYPLDAPEGRETSIRAWEALAGSRQTPTRYFALFNLADHKATIDYPVTGAHSLKNLWDSKRYPTKARRVTDAAGGKPGIIEGVHIALPAHGSAIFRVE